MTSFLLFFGGTVFGWLSLIGYGCYRAVNSDGWDDSNMLNWIRLFSHIVMHPEDFARMWYLEDEHVELLEAQHYFSGPFRPFPYINKDEFSENFPQSRPK
jgi:hypothetical protein